MNAERLVTAAKAALLEVQRSEIVGSTKSLVRHAEAAINSPNEQTQRTLETALNDVLKVLDATDFNQIDVPLRHVLDELRIQESPVTSLLGAGLAARLRDAASGGFTAVQTIDKLRTVQRQVAELQEKLQTLVLGLDGLAVPSEELESGTSVVGMTMPRQEVADLEELQKEIAFLDHLLDAVGECADGHVTQHGVRTLRSSDFGVDVDTSLKVAGLIAKIVRGVEYLLSKLQQYRDFKKRAEELVMPPDVIASIEQTVDQQADAAIDEIQAELMQECPVTDNGRVQEIRSHLRVRINGVANRIEKGYRFEVRTAVPTSADGEAKFQEMITSLKISTFERPSGPTLLELPESVTQQDGSATDGHSSHGAKKRGKKSTGA